MFKDPKILKFPLNLIQDFSMLNPILAIPCLNQILCYAYIFDIFGRLVHNYLMKCLKKNFVNFFELTKIRRHWKTLKKALII